MRTPLADAVGSFVADLAPVLTGIANRANMTKGYPAAGDVGLEAYNLASAFIDADGLHTDDELLAFVTTFAPRFDTVLQHATPGDIRRADLVNNKRRWLEKPSVLLQLLLGDDHRQCTTNTWAYFHGALAIAHAVSALDSHPSRSELEAIDAFRSMVLEAMDRWEVPRPGKAQGPGLGSSPAAGAGRRVEDGAAASSSGHPEGAQGSDAAELPPARPLDDLLAELDALVGLAPVKAEVRLVTNLLQVQRLRRERGLPVAESSHHLVFTGNPGTGKTTVARLLASIYRTLGVVEKGHLVESDRSQLVAGFVGQTAIQVRKVVESALGGVLLIDEAYALARGDERDFGQEAIDTLVNLIENYRDEMVVIAAGYPDEMAEFIDSNPGLRSRFPKTIAFPDYSTDELVGIFGSMCARASYSCDAGAKEAVRTWLDAQPRDKGFGNARLARNLFEAVVARQASRIVAMTNPTDEQLTSLMAADIAPAAQK
ncbi:MAG TPA: AAA family ATPase [Acidimicrobiales bacterium]|nr:AAA family ATPase [Acidimicrobiales bacterium]